MQDNELLDAVDENDIVIGTMTRKESKLTGKRYRIVRIVVNDDQGNTLIQKRVATKDTYPNCWDNAAAGHVDSGEDYASAATRELKEEVGLSGFDLKEVMYYYSEVVTPKGQKMNRFTKMYTVTVPHDTKFVCQKSEVSEVKWVKLDEIRKLVEAGTEVTDGLTQTYERYLKKLLDENY